MAVTDIPRIKGILGDTGQLHYKHIKVRNAIEILYLFT